MLVLSSDAGAASSIGAVARRSKIPVALIISTEDVYIMMVLVMSLKDYLAMLLYLSL
jgi:hypothetical protein